MKTVAYIICGIGFYGSMMHPIFIIALGLGAYLVNKYEKEESK